MRENIMNTKCKIICVLLLYVIKWNGQVVALILYGGNMFTHVKVAYKVFNETLFYYENRFYIFITEYKSRRLRNRITDRKFVIRYICTATVTSYYVIIAVIQLMLWINQAIILFQS